MSGLKSGPKTVAVSLERCESIGDDDVIDWGYRATAVHIAAVDLIDWAASWKAVALTRPGALFCDRLRDMKNGKHVLDRLTENVQSNEGMRAVVVVDW